MPARNNRYRTRTETYPDARRYYWRFHGAHVDELDAPTEEVLHANAIAARHKHKWSLGSLPIGLCTLDTIRIALDLALLPATFAGWLQDDGEWVTHDLYANVVGTLYCDMGNPLATDADFEAVWQGVQMFYAEPEIKGDTAKRTAVIEIDLVHIGSVVLSALPLATWSNDVKNRITTLGGDGSITAVTKDWSVERAWMDSRDFRYIIGSRQRGNTVGNEVQGVWISHVDAFEQLEELLLWTYRKLVREWTASFQFVSTEHTPGTPYDFKRMWKCATSIVGTTVTGTKGAELARSEKMWLAFVRTTAASTTPISGLLHETEGLPALYETAYDYLKEATEEGAARGFYYLGGTAGTTDTLYVGFYKIWDEEPTGPVTPALAAFLPGWSTKRGAGTAGGCTATTAKPGAQDVRERKHVVGGVSRTVPPFELKAIVTTMPTIPDDSAMYFAHAPATPGTARNIDPYEGDDTLCLASWDDYIIVANSRFNHWRWYYLERNEANGGPEVFNGPHDNIPCVVHHHTEYDFGGLAGSYAVSGDDLALPTWYDFLDPDQVTDEEYINQNRLFYEAFTKEILWGALTELMRRSDLWCLGSALGKIFSNRSQVATACSLIARRSTIAQAHPASRFTFHPSVFRTGIYPQVSSEAVLLECEVDHAAGVESVVLFNRATNQ